jgi:hypothetical protein
MRGRFTTWPCFALVVGLTVSACSETNAPYAGVGLRTEVAPATVLSGDTVVIRAVLTNPTARHVKFSDCGPPVLAQVIGIRGDTVLSAPPNLTYTCERRDVHQLEPGEVDTLVARWRVSVPSGQYRVQSGFRRGEVLERLTSPVTLTVRERV